MDKTDELVDYNEVDPNTGTFYNAPNEGDEDSPEKDDLAGWAFEDEQKAQHQAQHQAKYGDSIFYEPYVPKPPRGSVEDIQHKLRIAGTRLRKSLTRSLNSDPEAWTALRRPAPLHSARRTLAEMLGSVPLADHEHFHELGDGYVYMPLHTMEKYHATCNARATQLKLKGPI